MNCPVLGWMVKLDNPFTKVNRARDIIGLLGLAPGIKVLDDDCAPGRLAFPPREAVGSQGEALALDIQADKLVRVRKKVQATGFKGKNFFGRRLANSLHLEKAADS